MTVHRMASVPRMTCGAGARRELASLASGLVPAGAPVLLVADPGLAAVGMIDEVARLLGQGGFAVTVFTDIKSDPSEAQADAAARIARDEGAELLVALGGGSALDLGKAVACVAGAPEPAAHYALCANPLPATRLKTIVLPTTSGTGSETTRTAILSGEDQAKRWFWGEALKPDEVLLDPELTVSLPAFLTAATGIDALVHAVEAATNRNAHPANDLYALEAIRLVARHLETAVTTPTDLAAREGLQRAAALAGTAIDNCRHRDRAQYRPCARFVATPAPWAGGRHRHAGGAALDRRKARKRLSRAAPPPWGPSLPRRGSSSPTSGSCGGSVSTCRLPPSSPASRRTGWRPRWPGPRTSP